MVYLTGDPTRSWLDDLIARGPFGSAAMLGCDEDPLEASWMRAGASARLDVYDLSAEVIRRRRARAPRGVRFIRADLNFAHLPTERYDVIWSSGCLHHLVNLEHLMDQVSRALRPGGLFAFHDYVGENRFHFDLWRLARANAALCEVPVRFRRNGPDTSHVTRSPSTAAPSVPCAPRRCCRPRGSVSRSCTRASPRRCSRSRSSSTWRRSRAMRPTFSSACSRQKPKPWPIRR